MKEDLPCKSGLVKACGHFSGLEARSEVVQPRDPGRVASGFSNYLNHMRDLRGEL